MKGMIFLWFPGTTGYDHVIDSMPPQSDLLDPENQAESRQPNRATFGVKVTHSRSYATELMVPAFYEHLAEHIANLI